MALGSGIFSGRGNLVKHNLSNYGFGITFPGRGYFVLTCLVSRLVTILNVYWA